MRIESVTVSFKSNQFQAKPSVLLTHFSPVLHFIQKPVNRFAEQKKWLVSTWNATLGWNELNKHRIKAKKLWITCSFSLLNTTAFLSAPPKIKDTQVLIWIALRDLVSFVQFKKHEKHTWRSVAFSKVAGFNLQLYKKSHSSMDVFHVFYIVQIVPNHAKRHIRCFH